MDISPDKQNIDQVFANTTYYIDFYQRDYKWTDEPVVRLLDDLFYGFEATYQNKRDLDAKAENVVAYYPWYYLSTYVTNTVDGREYVVDGQQRLTTLTLILIKLFHQARKLDSKLDGWIRQKIAGQTGFDQRFWMNHERHVRTLEELFTDDSAIANISVESGQTAANMVSNYGLISSTINEKLPDKHRFETFVFYLLRRVVMVNLSVEQTDVPMVFEVINDRGVRLAPYEILKGKLLGQIDKFELDQSDFNGLWERQVRLINRQIVDDADNFFRYFLKAKFSDTRNLGQRFDGAYHREIFKADLNKQLGLEHNPKGVKQFLTGAFRYYTSLYSKIFDAAHSLDTHQPWVHLNALNEMDSQYLLILSACKIDDPEEDEKIRIISSQLDRLFVLLRLQRAYDSNEFNDAIFEISSAIRDGDASVIAPSFEKKLLEMLSENRSVPVSESFQYAFFKNTGVADMAPRFTRYFFARIDSFLAREMQMGLRHTIDELVTRTGAKTGFHIEHILAHNEENLRRYEGDVEGFEEDRGRLGAVLLLKGRDNQSSNAESYAEKLKTYASTLYWNETLRADSYKSKLDMKELMTRHKLTIQPYAAFGPDEVEGRQKLLFDIASIIWKKDAHFALMDKDVVA